MALSILKKIGYLFYVVDPKDSMFENLDELPNPNYITQAIPYFFGMMVLEWIIRYSKGMKPIRMNDGIMSISHGLIMIASDFFDKGIRVALYCYVYENYCLISLPWNALHTWIVAAILVDFFYYWAHRACHEINIFWAWHQVHHSSEDYNLTTALRQSALQHIASSAVNLPMALVVPPTAMIVHGSFNLLYQFWIHTEVIGDLGPLEYILNTSNHHRVHHGSNRYCLDKNYAGVLIIWDRLFGTFEKFRPEEKITYGLVGQPQFFNPLRHQLFYMKSVFEKACSMDNFSDKVSSFLKGPGWFPGTGRLGDLQMVPEFQDRTIYDPNTTFASKCYVLLHLFVSILIVTQFEAQNMNGWTILLMTSFVTWTLTSLGLIFDNSPSAWTSEIVRIGVFSLIFHQPMVQLWRNVMVPYKMVVMFYGISFLFASSSIVVSKIYRKAEAKKL